MPQPQRRQRSQRQRIPKAAPQHGPGILGAAPAQGFGGKVDRTGADACGAQGEGQLF